MFTLSYSTAMFLEDICGKELIQYIYRNKYISCMMLSCTLPDLCKLLYRNLTRFNPRKHCQSEIKAGLLACSTGKHLPIPCGTVVYYLPAAMLTHCRKLTVAGQPVICTQFPFNPAFQREPFICFDE